MDLKEFFNKKNPYAYQAITARMLEVVRKGYWHPSEEDKQTLAKEYVETVAKHGVACCEHTCNNPAFQEYVMNVLSGSGLADQDSLNTYAGILKAATGKLLDERKTEMDKVVQAQTPLLNRLEQTPVPAKIAEQKSEEKPHETSTDFLFSGAKNEFPLSQGGQKEAHKALPVEETEPVNGFEMEEVKTNEEKSAGVPDNASAWVNRSGRQWFPVIVIISCVGLFFYGWVRKKF